jgi:phospholipid/cholesterol/gamma-HCH transport system ATP-binding protein
MIHMNQLIPPQDSTPAREGPLAASTEIQIECLSKSFGSHRVLDDINLVVHSAEMIAFVGGSGTGKTTLLRHIIGLEHPDQGRVLLADHESVGSPLVDLATLDPESMERIERHWAVVFQGNALLAGRSVEANISLPLREVQHLDESTIRSKVREAVREVALDPEKDLDLTVDQLSGGMAKRVAVARALAMDPILLLYDEPTTGLDPQVSKHIQFLIEAIHNKKTASGFRRTSVFITHDKELLYRLQPRIIMLDSAHIVFDGTYGDFQNSESPIIRPYFELMPRLHSRTPDATEEMPRKSPS